MVTPQITINQVGKTSGASGQSREDLALGQVVTVTDTANGAGSYNWIFVPPVNSAVEALGLNTDTVTFTPDIAGTYLLYLNYNDQLSYTVNAIGDFVTTQGGAAVKLPNGYRIPGVGETTQYGTSGWAGAIDTKFRGDTVVKVGGSVVAGGPHKSINFLGVGGDSIWGADAGSGEVTVTISGAAAATHGWEHISVGGDEIDGDKLDIDWNPDNYTPNTDPTEVTSVDHLTAHLKGIDVALATAGVDVAVLDEGVQLQSSTTSIDFVGAGVTATASGSGVRVEIAGGGDGAALSTLDEGVELQSSTTSIDFVGAGVTATASGSGVRVEIAGGGDGAALSTLDEGVELQSSTTSIDFVGAGVTATASGTGVRVEIAGGGDGAALSTLDEGVELQSSTTSIDFVGAGVTATASGTGVRVEITGGGGSVGTGVDHHIARYDGTDELQSSDWVITDAGWLTGTEAGVQFSTAGASIGKQLYITSGATIKIEEAAAAVADSEGYGQIWVKNDTPNTLWFTDDTGDDYALGVGGDGGVADSLSTTGAAVDVAAAAPPSAGQVLVASDATHAIWQTISAGSGGDGALEYMDTINVTSAKSTVTFGAGGDGILGTALDGDNDGQYLIKYRIILSANDDIVIRPNGETTNQVSQRTTMESSRGTFTSMILIQGTTSTIKEEGELWFDARRTIAGVAHNRTYHTLSSYFGTAFYGRSCSGHWAETATNITSLVFAALGGANIIPGCSFDLYRLTTSGTGAGSALALYEEGLLVSATVSGIDFVGAGVTATASGTLMRVEIAGGGDGAALSTLDEGVELQSSTTSIDFVGAGVTATASGSGVRVEIAGGGDGGSADSLSTTGAAVDVSVAAPPTAGQVLKAVDATHASWQAEGVAARGDFIDAYLSAGQSQDWMPGDVVLFDAARDSRGITVSAGRFSWLKAGRTYLLIADLYALSGTTRFGWRWYDVTNAAYIGHSGYSVAPALNSTAEYPDVTLATICPTVDIQVELRCLLEATTAGAHALGSNEGCTGTIIELGAPAPFALYDEGSLVTSTVSGIDFVGAGVTATASGTLMRVEIAGGGLDYLTAALSAEQTLRLSANEHIEFDLSSRRGTSMSLSTGTAQDNGLFTLQPGKTYEILATISAKCNEGNCMLAWRDHSDDSTVIDDTTQTASFMWFRDNAAHDTVTAPAMVIVFTPLIETTIKLDVVSELNLSGWYPGSRVLIKEL